MLRRLAALGALLLICAVAAVGADQAPAAASAAAAPLSPDEQAVKTRTQSFYDAIIKRDFASAEQFVTPDTRVSLERMKKAEFLAVTVKSVKVSPDGTAIANVVRRVRAPLAGYMDFDYQQSLQRVDGQWLVVLPNSKKVVTPFGTFDREDANAPTPAAIMQERQKDVDPDQVVNAINKVDRTAAQQGSAGRSPAPDGASKPPSKPKQHQNP